VGKYDRWISSPWLLDALFPCKRKKYTASYDFKGDLLTVEGTFSAMSLKYDGDMEFDVSKIVKIILGGKNNHEIHLGRIILLIVITALVFVLWILKSFFTAKN